VDVFAPRPFRCRVNLLEEPSPKTPKGLSEGKKTSGDPIFFTVNWMLTRMGGAILLSSRDMVQAAVTSFLMEPASAGN
jgi:hypothetical protein